MRDRMTTQEVFNNLYKLNTDAQLIRKVGNKISYVWVNEEFYNSVLKVKDLDEWSNYNGLSIVVSNIDLPYKFNIKQC